VTKINLVIGNMTGIVADCVQFYMDFMSKDTIAEGAKVVVTMVPSRAKCRDCHQEFELKEFEWTCPHCGGSSLEIIAGKELFLESIEVT
jgi:hydrogenase nickel incorporation protein HypA/HybF